MPTPKAILFDWDNTLVDTWPIIHQALTDTFTAMGQKPWTYEETREKVQKSMRDYFPVIFGDEWEKAGQVYQDAYQAIHLEKLQALPEAETVLKHLTGTDIYVAVVSNKKGHNLRAEAEKIGWNDYFSRLIGADDAGRDKPSPDPVYLALESSGIAPGEHVWFIGDSVIDIECAYNSGCYPMLYGDYIPKGIAEDRPHKHHVRDHSSLHKLLQAL